MARQGFAAAAPWEPRGLEAAARFKHGREPGAAVAADEEEEAGGGGLALFTQPPNPRHTVTTMGVRARMLAGIASGVPLRKSPQTALLPPAAVHIFRLPTPWTIVLRSLPSEFTGQVAPPWPSRLVRP